MALHKSTLVALPKPTLVAQAHLASSPGSLCGRRIERRAWYKLHTHARNLTNFQVIRIFPVHVCKFMTFNGKASATELVGRGQSASSKASYNVATASDSRLIYALKSFTRLFVRTPRRITDASIQASMEQVRCRGGHP